jgi:hypothetical protein
MIEETGQIKRKGGILTSFLLVLRIAKIESVREGRNFSSGNTDHLRDNPDTLKTFD